MICRKCKRSVFYKDGFDPIDGQQVWRCKYCGTRRREKLNIFTNPNKIECTTCASTNITKCGKGRNGEQRYKCKDCGKRFQLEISHKSGFDSNETHIIIMYCINMKRPIKEVADYLHRDRKAISEFIKEYKKLKQIP